MTHLKRLAVSP